MSPPASQRHYRYAPTDAYGDGEPSSSSSPKDRLDHSSACPEVRIDIPSGADPDVDRLLEPLAREKGTLRCRVRRLREKSVLELFVEEGNIFVLSASRSGKDWLIAEQQVAQGCEKRKHLARLRTHKDRTFTCTRGRHDGTGAPMELLFVGHSTQNLSEDLPDLNVMRVALPRPPLANLDSPYGVLGARLRQSYDRGERVGDDLTLLESRSPKWNSRTETFELPFGGRANHASARNFQLVARGASDDRVVLLYGKMEDDEFALDFAHPLSVLHAFAIVLTTFGW